MELVAQNFEAYPLDSRAYRNLWPLLEQCRKLHFTGQIGEKNNNQITLDFDKRFAAMLVDHGATKIGLTLSMGVEQDYDFAFDYNRKRVAVEVEKSNREKILYDILKSHIYLKEDADFAMLVLPKNYAHRHGEWDLFDMGKERYKLCLNYNFGQRENFDRILLVGYEQTTSEGEPLTAQLRDKLISNWRNSA